MEAVERIPIYNTLFYVSLGVAILGLILAAFFFFYFNIPTVRAMMTGKAKKDTIRRMEEQNAKTGRLRAPISGTMGKTGSTGRTQPQTPVQKQAVTQPVPHTTEDVRPETQVLQTAVPETAVLQSSALETTVLGQETKIQEEECGKTEMLHPMEQTQFRFLVTETTLVVHTDEVI